MYSGVNQSLAFYDNTFEPLINGRAAAFDCAPGEALQGFIWQGNWHGDVGTAGAGYWVNVGSVRGAQFTGNFFAHSGLGAGDYAIQITNGSYGVSVANNVFFDKAINILASTSGFFATGNSFGSTSINGAAFLSKQSTVVSNFGRNGLPRSKAYALSNQSIATSTHTAVVFDGEFYEQGPIHSTTVNNTRFTIPVGAAGLYQFSAAVLFSSGIGLAWVRIRRNGSAIVSSVFARLDTSAQITVSISGEDVSSEGDYYELTVWQNTGGNLNIIGNANIAADTQMAVSQVFTGD
jgi:hypothetical protein